MPNVMQDCYQSKFVSFCGCFVLTLRLSGIVNDAVANRCAPMRSRDRL